MNIFRLVGDLSHLLAVILLLHNIFKRRSCAGLSGKSQVMYALVFTTRYLDLFSNFVSWYNTCFKLFYLTATYFTIHLIYMKFDATYDRYSDRFRIVFLVVPVAVLAFLVNHDTNLQEILWTFSIYLESVAILPQLFMFSMAGRVETGMSRYLLALGSYRLFYIFNWIYRYYYEGFFDLIIIVAGCVQVIPYCHFFFYYIKNRGDLNTTNYNFPCKLVNMLTLMICSDSTAPPMKMETQPNIRDETMHMLVNMVEVCDLKPQGVAAKEELNSSPAAVHGADCCHVDDVDITDSIATTNGTFEQLRIDTVLGIQRESIQVQDHEKG